MHVTRGKVGPEVALQGQLYMSDLHVHVYHGDCRI